MPFNPLQAFLQEAKELIADIEQSALDLASENSHTETVHRLFRAFHTIKGSGSMCGLDSLAGFTHHVESLLEKMRDGLIPVSASTTEIILKATDHIRALLDAAQEGTQVPEEAGELLVATIKAFTNSGNPSSPEAFQNAAKEKADDSACCESTWIIQFEPNRALLANGGNPAGLLNDLRKLGPCDVTAGTEAIPALNEIEADSCYLSWTIKLRSNCTEDAIRDVFIFVEDESKLIIGKVEVGQAQLLSESGQSLNSAEDAAIAQSSGITSTPAQKKRTPDEATVRVPAERLDRLVNLVGELVMNHSSLAQAVARAGAREFANPVQVLERLVAELLNLA